MKDRLKKFSKEYEKLTGKYGLDFQATIGCRNRLAEWLFNKLGKRHIVATMRIVKK